MGSSHSIEIPGGGTEGYHVLRVKKICQNIIIFFVNSFKYFLIE